MLQKILAFLRGLARIVSRPARAVVSRRGIIIQPYRGYGTSKEIFMIGRVMRQPSRLGNNDANTLGGQLLEIGRWAVRRGIGKVPVIARFYGAEQRLHADRDGYFRIHIRPALPLPLDRQWHDIEIELERPENLVTQGEVFIPSSPARYVVISDIDDTIIDTGVADRLRMVWGLIGKSADARVALPGMAAFLSALYRGPSGDGHAPMLYVSRAPWAIYDLLDEFFHIQDIPGGPLLFLREWGLTLQSPLPRRAKNHKEELIRNMLALYDGTPFILIGDSGQTDPEIYARIVHENHGRVRAIYIRQIDPDDVRDQEIRDLAKEVSEAGTQLVLAKDAGDMARHALAHGLITETSARDVELEVSSAQDGQTGLAA